jgi:hypothetical protein
MTVTGDSTVQGLEMAVFEGDQSQLKVIVKESEDPEKDFYFVAFGWQQEQQQSFATAGHAEKVGQAFKSTQSQLLTGTVVAGDPLANVKCPNGQTSRTQSFTLGTARFDADICEFLGGGETTGYNFTSLTITDSSASLTPEQRQPLTIAKADIPSKLKYKWNHHNACDSFHLDLGHVQYAATAAQMAGCGQTVENAPARTFQHDPAPDKVLYRVKYGNGAWQDFQAGCAHYMFFCGS